MYEKHFKLNSRLFPAMPAGADIFVSPQAAASLSRMKKALATPDTIITVTGHAGVGKSTLVSRTLHTISGKNAIVRIGEKKLDPDDVLEMLLVALGTAKVPAGTIQKLRFFRQLLDSLATQNSRVFIVIEDTAKTCPETLSELEALTAADTGFSCGANILLMANGSLDDLLGLPLLARLHQRARLRELVQPFTPEELRGYLNHSFRLADGDFENIFAEGATELLHTFGGGVARVVNKIVETVLTEAAQQKTDKIDLALIKRGAMEEFGLAEEPIPELIQDTLPQIAILKPELAGSEVPAPSQPTPVDAARAKSDATPPNPAAASALQQETAQAALPAENSEVPAWDRDPTLAELRPDLDALEQAMAVAQGRGKDSNGEETPKPDAPQEAVDGQAASVPEITLDNSIQKKVNKAELELQQRREEEEARRAANANGPNAGDGVEVPPDLAELELQQRKAEEARHAVPVNGTDVDDDVEAAPAQAVAASEQTTAANDANNSKLSPAELQQIATDLAKAKTIEDVDDKLAETLFGEEINLIAAQVIANPPPAEPAASAQQIATAEPANSPHEPVVAPTAPAIDTSTAPPANGQGNAHGITQSQRLRTVKALNSVDTHSAAPTKTSRPPTAAEPPAPAPAGDQPESIEEQISTSVTQSLKALDEKSIPAAADEDEDEDDDDDTKKSGFFSRFKRS